MFAVFAVLLLAMLGAAGRSLESEEFIERRVAVLDSAGKGEAVVTGASVARHIELPVLCLEGVNLWEAQQDIFEIAAISRHLEREGRVPPVWIIGFLPGFTLVDKGADAASGVERRVLVYRMLQASGDYRLIGGDWQGAMRSVATPVLGYKDWMQRLGAGGEFGKRRPASDVPLADMQTGATQARKWAARIRTEQDKVRFHDDGISERASTQLRMMNRQLVANGSRLVLVEMPVTPEVVRQGFATTATDLEREDILLEELSAAGAVVVRSAELPDQPLSRFRDFLHLTRSGGAAFSSDLAAELSERGVIEEPACAAAQAGS